jgi:hypothetical protein
MGEKRNAGRILVETPEGNRPLRKPGSRWKNNIKMDFRERGWDGIVWSYPAQKRDQCQVLMNTVMNPRVP